MKFGFNRLPKHAVFFNESPNPEGESGGGTQVEIPPENQHQETPPSGNVSGDPKSDNYFSNQSRTEALSKLFSGSKGEPKSNDKTKQEPPKSTQDKPTEDKAKNAPIVGLEVPKPVKTEPEAIPELDALAPKNPKDIQGFSVLKQKMNEIVHKEREKSSALERSLGEAKIKFEEEKSQFQKQLDELKGFQMAADIHADPEFQSKFIRPIETHKAVIKSTLLGVGANEEHVNTLLKKEDVNSMEEVAQALAEKGYHKEAGIIRSKAARIAELEADRDVEINNSKTKWKEITQQKAISAQTRQAEFKTKVSAHLENLAKSKDKEGKPEYAVLTELVAPPDANEEVKKQIQEHNNFVKQARDQALYLATVDDPKVRTDAALGAIMGGLLDKAYTKLSKEHEALQKEFERVTNAAPKPKSRPQSTITENPSQKVDVSMNAKQALAARFGNR
jgi:hypothetical protein